MNVKFHKNCENTSKILKISCVRCNFVKFDIRFLMTSYNEGSFFLVARERTLGTRLVFAEATTVVSRTERKFGHSKYFIFKMKDPTGLELVQRFTSRAHSTSCRLKKRKVSLF